MPQQSQSNLGELQICFVYSSTKIDRNNSPSSSCSSSSPNNNTKHKNLPPASLSSNSACSSTGRRKGVSPDAQKAGPSISREQRQDFNSHKRIKVSKDGQLIGRKVDLLASQNYDGLISELSQMFNATTCRNGDRADRVQNLHVLTYEDREGQWRIVGDVPWEMFITTVKKLKITRA